MVTTGGFARLWSASLASNLGDGLVLAAFPLIALNISDDPLAISAITVAVGLPWLLLGPVAGAVVDRFDRRMLMVSVDLFRAAVLGVFASQVAGGSPRLWSLYLVVLLIASGETVVDTSAQALLPSLVPADRLDAANGRLFSTMTVANRFIGPPLGGLLFGVAAFLPAAADSLSFLLAGLLMLGVRGRFKPEVESTPAGRSLRADITEGMRWMWRHRPIRTFALGAATINIGTLAGESILVLFAAEQLDLSSFGFGALFAATAVGYVAGSALAPRLTARHGRLGLVGSAVTAIALALFGTGVARHWTVAAGGLAVVGLAGGVWDVIAVSYRQAVVPDRLLGRIMSAYRVIAHGSVPIGAALGGLTARLAGNRAPFLVGAVVVLAYLPLLRSGLLGVDLDPARALRADPA